MLIEQVKRAIDYYRLLEKGDRVIVGLSGGMDSMVLLHILNTLRDQFSLSLIIAHIHHGLRPVESEREAQFIQQESLRLGLPLEYRQFNVKAFQELRGFSLQDAARRLRFQFFHELLRKFGGGKIALGHHADDQIETVLLRLLRGSGLRGLKGMLPIRQGRIIRPLLEIWREEIESFAIKNSIPYLVDSSNLKDDYLRNRLRLNLIPLIEQDYQPGFRRAILRTSKILREEDDYIEKEAERAYQQTIFEVENGIGFKYGPFCSLHPAIQWRVIQKILSTIACDSNIDESHWSEINIVFRRLFKPQANLLLELSHGLYLEKRYDIVLLKKGRVKPIPPFDVELQVPGGTHVPEIGKKVVTEERDWDRSQSMDESPNVAFLDYDQLDLPLRMRNFRPGDRFQPLGAKGTQKLKEFFIDHKISKLERPSIPLLISCERIAWIVGYRIDERFKVTSQTRKVLKVEIIEKRGP